MQRMMKCFPLYVRLIGHTGSHRAQVEEELDAQEESDEADEVDE